MTDRSADFLFLTALVLPFICFAFLCIKWPRIGYTAMMLYLLTYAWLSVSGCYVVNNYGGAEWRREWCPQRLVVAYHAPSGRTRTKLTSLGALYWLCMRLDRLAWHRTTITL